MKLRSPRFWIAVATATVVVTVAIVDMRRTSPGPISAVHAQIPDLTGFRNCAQCHGGWFESMTEACLTCHRPIVDQMESGAGLHGALGKQKAEQCATCHSEHHGADFLLVNRQSFVRSGIPEPDAFDHKMIGFEMEGKHLELTCSECHKMAEATLLREGERRFQGLVQNCAQCHDEPHEGRMRLACADCHVQLGFDQHHAPGHERRLPLLGGHGDQTCRTCHAKDDAVHALELMGGAATPETRECKTCHESPHRASFVQGVARLESTTPGATCVACHVAGHTSFREKGLETTPEHHAVSGFALDKPHEEVTCEKCHPSAHESFAERYPGRARNECQACHEDVHGGQFQGVECIQCHDPHGFKPHAFTVEKHASAVMKLTGRHVDVDCNECHKPLFENRPRVFRGTKSRCEECHWDAHDGFFDKHRAELAKPKGGTCARCHDTETFSKFAQGSFDHGNWTGFPVRGAHAQSDCESCHPRSEEPDRFGRTLGRVRAHFGIYTNCATCHRDPHAGRFGKEGATQCQACHIETSFRSFPKGFDHKRWTGFALDGMHADARCTACHTPLRKVDRTGRTWEEAKGKRCADCHDDPHADQFRRDGLTDCSRCHSPASTFKEITFRHLSGSRFRLGKPHRALACSKCHLPEREDGVEFIRYRPLGTNCGDCHLVPEDPSERYEGRKR